MGVGLTSELLKDQTYQQVKISALQLPTPRAERNSSIDTKDDGVGSMVMASAEKNSRSRNSPPRRHGENDVGRVRH
jgi:hypothetical protein